jgi:kinesin family protein 2/24
MNKELKKGDIDCISVANPSVSVHECKLKVDGISKYIENHDFVFDNSFGENSETSEVYQNSVKPLLNNLLEKGVVTVFAYG